MPERTMSCREIPEYLDDTHVADLVTVGHFVTGTVAANIRTEYVEAAATGSVGGGVAQEVYPSITTSPSSVSMR